MKTKWILKLVNGLAIVLIAASVLILLSVVLTPAGETPRVLGCSIFRVVSGSMEPKVPLNSLLVVRKTDPAEIQPGDVISFFSPDPMLDGAVNTHRVQRVEQREGELWFHTKGDANVLEDTYPVSEKMVVGRMIFVSTALGVLVSLLSNPLVFGGLIMLPLVVILVLNLVRAVRIASNLAKQEEEAALRQALEALREKQKQSQGSEK